MMGRLERKATESKETHQRERTQFTGLASHGRRKEGRTIPSTVGRVLLHRVADRNDLRSMCACVVWCGVPNCVGIDKPAGYSLSLSECLPTSTPLVLSNTAFTTVQPIITIIVTS